MCASSSSPTAFQRKQEDEEDTTWANVPGGRHDGWLGAIRCGYCLVGFRVPSTSCLRLRGRDGSNDETEPPMVGQLDDAALTGITWYCSHCAASSSSLSSHSVNAAHARSTETTATAANGLRCDFGVSRTLAELRESMSRCADEHHRRRRSCGVKKSAYERCAGEERCAARSDGFAPAEDRTIGHRAQRDVVVGIAQTKGHDACHLTFTLGPAAAATRCHFLSNGSELDAEGVTQEGSNWQGNSGPERHGLGPLTWLAQLPSVPFLWASCANCGDDDVEVVL